MKEIIILLRDVEDDEMEMLQSFTSVQLLRKRLFGYLETHGFNGGELLLVNGDGEVLRHILTNTPVSIVDRTLSYQ